jgi:membrane-bound serine protease (ClpP class)
MMMHSKSVRFTRWTHSVALVLATWLVLGVSGDEKPQETKPAKYLRPVLIPFYDDINPLSEQSFYRKLAAAEEYRADLLIVEIDSPGGWVDCSLNLAERLRNIQWARTVAFIPREAISGGAVMALGCDDIVMAPLAVMGDAGEIFRDEKGAFRYVPEKARSYLASRLRVLAQAKGRSPALAEAMCDMDLDVYLVRHKEKGTESFLSEHEIASSGNPDQWEKIKPVFGSRDKHFLTVHGQEAIELKLAQSLQSDRNDLKKHYQLANEIVVLRHTTVDTAVTILNTPIITGLLFVIGLIALYVEFTMPGTFIGGLIAGLCFALFFWSRFLGGTSGWLEIILFFAGISFLAMEIFVIPGFGVAGISGILLLITSVVMASQSFLIPHTGRELNVTLVQFGIVLTSGLVFFASAAVLTRYLGALPVARSLMLEMPTEPAVHPVRQDDPVQKPSPNPMVPRVVLGDHGIADSPLRPAGKIRVGDQYIDVVSDGTFIDAGRPVRIIEISGNRIVVRSAES